MPEKPRPRAEALKALREAELEGSRLEARARERLAQVKASTQAECSDILERAEKEGRALMRQSVEAAKGECAALRRERLSRSDIEVKAWETEAAARFGDVSRAMLRRFAEEYDVED